MCILRESKHVNCETKFVLHSIVFTVYTEKKSLQSFTHKTKKKYAWDAVAKLLFHLLNYFWLCMKNVAFCNLVCVAVVGFFCVRGAVMMMMIVGRLHIAHIVQSEHIYDYAEQKLLLIN